MRASPAPLRLAAFAFATLCALTPNVVRAQSFFLAEGSLHAEGVRVGAASRAPVRVVAAHGENVSIAYEGRRIRFEAEIALDESHLQVGVSRDAVLSETTFATTMLRGTWGPVMEMNDTRIRIGLPLGSPEAEATLTRDARLSGAPRPDSGPWEYSDRVPADDAEFHCTNFMLAPTPQGAATFHPPNEAARHLIRTEGTLDVFEVTLQGFVFTGFRAHASPCEAEEGLGGMALSATGGDGAGRHRTVVLQPHTELYATPTSTHPFARLQTRAYGIEVEVGEPSQFVVEVHEGSATVLLHFYLHIPNSALRDAPPGHHGFGMTHNRMPDWPTRHPQQTP